MDTSYLQAEDSDMTPGQYERTPEIREQLSKKMKAHWRKKRIEKSVLIKHGIKGTNAKPTEIARAKRADKFQQTAEKRTNKVIEAIRTLRLLHNRNTYHYTDKEVGMIFGTIQNHLDEARSVFSPEDDPKRTGFKLR